MAGHDFHPLSLVGSKVELAGIDQAQGLLGTVRKTDRVRHHLALKIDIGFGGGSDVVEFARNRHRGELVQSRIALQWPSHNPGKLSNLYNLGCLYVFTTIKKPQ